MKAGFAVSVALIMAALFFADRSLARMEQRELRKEADALRDTGQRLLASGRAADAIVPLQRARALVRSDRQVHLLLAEALLGANRVRDAETNLGDLLESNSNDGAANLSMARVQVRLGRNREAEAYYHRAIYGTWPGGDRGSEARMEFAGVLAKRGEKRQLLSELLLLQQRPEQTLSFRKNIAHLLMVAGTPGRAAEVYSGLLRENPEDPEIYLGLADAEFASGRYDAARTQLRRGLRRLPDNSDLQGRLELVSTLTELDPTPRWLTSRQKYDRSLQVLRLAREDLRECARSWGVEGKFQAFLASAEKQEKTKGPITNESSESILALAQSLWQTRLRACGTPEVANADPLPLLMVKIGQ